MYEESLAPGTAFVPENTEAPTNLIGVGSYGYARKLSEYNKGYAYVKRSCIPKVISLPKMFELLNDSDVWYAFAKELLETGCREITGLNATVQHAHVETPLDRLGNIMHTPGKTTITPSVLSTVIPEKSGMPNSRFLEAWIYLGMDDPNTGVPGISSLVPAETPLRLTPDFVSAKVLYIEPDPFHRSVVRAWLMMNVMPKSGGTIEGKYDEFGSRDQLDLSIEWTGYHVLGEGVDKLASEILEQSSIVGAISTKQELWFDGISGVVSDADNAGYQSTIDSVADNQTS